jgi:hypothetical protein
MYSFIRAAVLNHARFQAHARIHADVSMYVMTTCNREHPHPTVSDGVHCEQAEVKSAAQQHVMLLRHYVWSEDSSQRRLLALCV